MNDNEYSHLNGLHLTKEECQILAKLKRKREAEEKKYRKIYGKQD
jgi:hypothetical protein